MTAFAESSSQDGRGSKGCLVTFNFGGGTVIGKIRRLKRWGRLKSAGGADTLAVANTLGSRNYSPSCLLAQALIRKMPKKYSLSMSKVCTHKTWHLQWLEVGRMALSKGRCLHGVQSVSTIGIRPRTPI